MDVRKADQSTSSHNSIATRRRKDEDRSYIKAEEEAKERRTWHALMSALASSAGTRDNPPAKGVSLTEGAERNEGREATD